MNDSNPITTEQVYNLLSQVIDPEIGCNIVDLGLIYSVEILDRKVVVKMTLTTRGCPMHESIASGVELAVLSVDGVEEVDVQIVWDPPWDTSMMTEFAREHVGLSQF